VESRTNRQLRAAGTRFETRQEGDDRWIEGYFAVFGCLYELWPDATESIAPTAFDGALEDDVRALCDHDSRLVLGRIRAGTLELRVDARGLWGRIKINPNDQDALNLYARVQRGDVDQCSFGFDILDEHAEYREDGSVHWEIRRVKLYEVSVVTFPAYEETAVEARRQDARQLAARRVDAWKRKMKERMRDHVKKS
jgi:HK97 family phage prohead protease